MNKPPFAKPLLLLFSGLLMVEASGQETYLLARKAYVPPAGSLMSLERTMTIKDAGMVIQAQGQEIEGKSDNLTKTEETVEVLAADKLRGLVKASDSKNTITINGQEQETPSQSDPLLNAPYLLELKDGKWTASLEGGKEPTERQKAQLKKKEEAANRDADVEMYGSTPRKVGDTWKADPAKIGIGDAADVKGEYTVTFVEVKDIGGVKCAVLKATFDFVGKMDPAENKDATIAMKGEAVSIRSIADMADLEVRLNAATTLNLSPSEGIRIQITGPTEMIQKASIKKP